MPATISYPGVYVEEIPSGVRTIVGVATSITAFVGYTRKGEPNRAIAISCYGEFERLFGGLDRDSSVSYAVNQFFMNGGSQAIIVRVGSGYKRAEWELKDSSDNSVLVVTASSPGTWGNNLRISIDYNDSRNKDSEFNLLVKEVSSDGTFQTREIHRNLSMDLKSSNYVSSVVNTASRLIKVTRKPDLVFGVKGYALSKEITFPIESEDRVIAGVVNGSDPFQLTLSETPANHNDLVDKVTKSIQVAGLEEKLEAKLSKPDGTEENDKKCLKLASKTPGESSRVVIYGGSLNSFVSKIGLGLANGGREFTGDIEHRPKELTDSIPVSKGDDGGKGGAKEIIGSLGDMSGLYALQRVELFNLLCVPETFSLDEESAKTVIQAGVDICEKRRAFYLVDPPSVKTITDIASWANNVSQSRYAAIYFPALKIADPLDGFRPRDMPASGTLAGIFARTDAERGVWKAPAGTDAALKGTAALTYVMNDKENGDINQKGVNALRMFSAYGNVAWGARTMKGSDQQADEYKYIPVRRLALFLEESLYRGTQWVVFEPNDEPLWAQVRLNIGAFMHNLFRQGAFAGATSKDAYFVKCDKETTPPDQVNLGIINIVVGFAPLKPAEFVVIQIQQMAGQIQV
jgi:phage tail sheath protein FI